MLGPSILALRLFLSLPSARLSPCPSDVKYHPSAHLHLIFPRPLPLPISFSFLTPLVAAKSICCSLYMLPSFPTSLFLFFFYSSSSITLSASLSKPFGDRQSYASPPHPPEHASAGGSKGAGMVTDWPVWEHLSSYKGREEYQTRKRFSSSGKPHCEPPGRLSSIEIHMHTNLITGLSAHLHRVPLSLPVTSSGLLLS